MKALESQIELLYKLLRHEGSWSQMFCRDVVNKIFIDRRMVYGIEEILKWSRTYNGEGNCFIGRNPRNEDGSVAKITGFTVDLDRTTTDNYVLDVRRARDLNAATYKELLAASGTGFLLLYPFEREWPPGTSGRGVEEGVRDKIRELGYGGIFKVDSTFDDARMVKLIGTVSCKAGGRLTRFLDFPQGKYDHLTDLVSKNLPTLPNETGWVAEALQNLAPGNIHPTTVKIIGKLHRDKWTKSEIRALLSPHIERVGGDEEAFDTRLDSITNYSVADQIIRDANNQEQSFSDFLASGSAQVDWFVDNLIPSSNIVFIAGLSETRKSWMLMDLAIECAKGGGYWLGKYGVRDGTVLYIEQERFRDEPIKRFIKLCAAKNLVPSQLNSTLHVQCGTSYRINQDDSFNSLYKTISELKPMVVLIDSFGTFHTRNGNSKSDMQIVFERVKELRQKFKCAFVFIDHETKKVLDPLRKDIEPNAHDSEGSAEKVRVAEVFFTVRMDKHGDSVVYHTKATGGPRIPPFIIKVEDLGPGKTSIKGY